jgi:non-ribosomal peptide synthetase component F
VTVARSKSAPAPLSASQEALWYRFLLAPQQIPYNETISIRKDGPLDLPALRLAFNEVVGRHEAWHTRFDVIDGEPVQVVEPPPRYELPLIDLSHLTFEEAEKEAVQAVAEVATIPYDLRRGPMLRPFLFGFTGEHHRLYLAMHHMIFDGVSVTRVVLGELVALYNSICAGERSPLEEATAGYGDYARWEQEWVTEPRARRRVDHWRERFANLPSAGFPQDRPRPPTPRFRGAAVPLRVAPEAIARLRAIGQANSSTLFQVLAALWALLESRHSGCDDVVFAVAADLRQRPELEALVGYCLTPLPVRVDTSGDPSFAELVVRVRNELLDGLDNMLPFERLVRELQPGAESTANPVYRTMFVLEPFTPPTDPAWSLHQIDSVMNNAAGVCKLDLELQLDERDDGHIDGQLIYDTDLFDRETAARIASNWLHLLDGAAGGSAGPAAEIEMLSPEERHRQLTVWNATTTVRPFTAVHDQFKAVAETQPHSAAISAGDAVTSYGQLDRWADVIADRCSTAGVAVGDRVAVCVEPSAKLGAAALGVLRAGASYVLIDPRLPAPQRDLILSSANVAAIVSEPETADLPQSLIEVPLADDPPAAAPPDASPPASVTAETAVAVDWIATDSDDTSTAVLNHGAAQNVTEALATVLVMSRADSVLSLRSSLFELPLIDLWVPLLSGARLVIAPAEIELDGARLSSLIRAERITFMHAQPSTWQRLIDTGMRPARGLRALSGTPLTEELARSLLDRCRVLWNGFGAVETAGYCAIGRVERPEAVAIVRPIANTRLYVVDRNDQPLPVGVTGWLLVGGDSVTPSYAITDPFGDGRVFRTGKSARWRPDGRVELTDLRHHDRTPA